MGHLNIFYIFMTALFSSLLLIPKLRHWAVQKGALDLPGQRKVHDAPMPRLGGIGIFISFLFSILLHVQISQEIRALLIGGLIIFTIGLLDDLRPLSPRTKFIGQVIACVLTMTLGNLYITDLGNLFGQENVSLPFWLAAPFTVFAVVGVCNAVNLIDGLDGLAGGVAMIALAAFFLLGYTTGNDVAMLLCAALTGAVLGFLKYNSYPARIFMGDSGSLTVGFFLGFLAIMLTQGQSNPIAPVIPFVILGLPIIDTLWVMTGRILNGQSPFTPDKTHVHHQFLDLGFHHRFTVIAIYGISTFWAVVALAFNDYPAHVVFYGYLITNIGFYLLLRFMVKNKENFHLLRKDSSKSIRETVLFGNLCGYADRLGQVLAILITIYFLAGASRGIEANPILRDVSILIFAGGMLVLLLSRDISNQFSLFFLYAAALIIIFQNEQISHLQVAGNVTNDHLAGIFFILSAIFVMFKAIFRKPTELIFSTPLDFLILAMSVSLAIISPDLHIVFDLKQAIGRAMIFFLAIKVVAITGSMPLRLVYFGGQAYLMMIILRAF